MLKAHSNLDFSREFSEITPQMYICGVDELNVTNMRAFGITAIVCCTEVYDEMTQTQKVLLQNSGLVGILQLPLEDTTKQNLWEPNTKKIRYCKLADTIDEFDRRNIDIIEYYNGTPMIEIAYDFCNKMIDPSNPKTKILIHCYMGKSRSVAIATFVLMNRYRLSFEDAFKIIKGRRRIADPNQSFVAQLQSYDQYRRRSSMSMISLPWC